MPVNQIIDKRIADMAMPIYEELYSKDINLQTQCLRLYL